MHLKELKKKTPAELVEMAEELEVENASSMRTQDMLFAIKADIEGGSTLRDFSNAEGMAGHFQTTANVYGREGAPCHACGTAIRLLRQGQRSSYFCPQCQRP